MIRLTRNQWIFAVVFAAYSIVFHTLLNRALDSGHHEQIWMFSVGYGVATFLTALALGAFDSVRQNRSDLGFGYHLVTFVIGIAAWVGWIVLGRASDEQWSPMYIFGMAAWAFGLALHYSASRASIKGIPKSRMFE